LTFLSSAQLSVKNENVEPKLCFIFAKKATNYTSNLPGFPMSGMSVAESAEFLELKTIRIVALVLHGCIVSLLAVRACHCDNYPHDVHLPKQNLKPYIARINGLAGYQTSAFTAAESAKVKAQPKLPDAAKNTHLGKFLGLPELLYHRTYSVSRMIRACRGTAGQA
jgi:hypothetical protein